ncbi:hypothetical protein EVAR_21997_1 [Eumeta japonica]|uniref:Uncharacterized protein n=1 Tax=Eumeta variegata TaxID=151549 RepID=A0A4C1YZ41_EUMVA|nr:hypothetical protein EVAR_21997_1 [Eumeta japonica]
MGKWTDGGESELMKGGGGPPELSLTGRNVTVEDVTSRVYSTLHGYGREQREAVIGKDETRASLTTEGAGKILRNRKTSRTYRSSEEPHHSTCYEELCSKFNLEDKTKTDGIYRRTRVTTTASLSRNKNGYITSYVAAIEKH